jgi:murein DD-endopeptidase MepM/ murein hydrolase activator NlpD
LRPLRLLLRLATTIVLALPVTTISTELRSQCSSDWLCINAVREAENVELLAANLRDVPITFTMRVRTRSMTADGPTTVTETLEPQQTRLVMVLRPAATAQFVSEDDFRISYEWTVGNKDAVHDEGQVYALPYAAGKSFRVLQGYGSRFSHTGLEQFAVDFRMPEGTPVHAARGGLVARIEESHDIGCWEDGCGKYANFIVILHDDGTTGEYYHLQQNGVLVDAGQRVSAGEKIGLSGNTGHTTVPHLHFAVYRAAEWGSTQSIPVRFATADGIIDRPRRGGRYQATVTPAPQYTGKVNHAREQKTHTPR